MNTDTDIGLDDLFVWVAHGPDGKETVPTIPARMPDGNVAQTLLVYRNMQDAVRAAGAAQLVAERSGSPVRLYAFSRNTSCLQVVGGG